MPYRYTTLPEACKCEKCGYVLENPQKHCQEIPCPKCGGRMWRVSGSSESPEVEDRNKIKWKKPLYVDKIVEMSPLEYLSKVPSPCREGVSADKDINLKGCFSESSIKYITEQVKRGEELDIPFIDYERMWFGFPAHEGRHRALVAYRMGIKKIPVVVFGEGSYASMPYQSINPRKPQYPTPEEAVRHFLEGISYG